MNKPKMVVFSKLFWPEGSGADLVTYILIKEVMSKYFDITVVSGTNNPSFDILNVCRYVCWQILKSKYKPVEWIKLFSSNHTLSKLVNGAEIIYIPSHTLLPLAIYAKMIKPNIRVVVHLHGYQPLTFTSIVLADREPDLTTDLIVELNEHRSLLRTFFSTIGHYTNFINKLSLFYADKIICVSKRQLEILTKYIPLIKDRSIVVYNPLLIPNIEKKPEKIPTILYVGGDSYIKGFHKAVKILTSILTEYNCKAYIAGRTSTKQMLLLKKLSKKLDERLIPLGRISHEELLNLQSRVWCLLFTSINEETFSYAVVESMVLGTIPIASRVGGVAEIVEGTLAEKFLCKQGDVNCFIEKIEEVSSLPYEELINIGLELREETIKRFNIEDIKNKVTNSLMSLIKG